MKQLYDRQPYTALAIFFVLSVGLNIVGRTFFADLGDGRGWERVLSNPLSVFNKFSPSIAGLVCIWLFLGRRALQAFFQRFFELGPDARMLLFAFLYPLVVMLAALSLYVFVSGETPELSGGVSLVGLLGAAGYQYSLRTFAGGGLGEEIGWRAFAMPLLLPRIGPVWTTLMIGILWSAWHWPGIIGSEAWFPEIVEHLYITTLITIVFTYFYLKSHGSVLVAIVLHGSLNGSFTFGAVTLAPALGISSNWQPYFDWLFIGGGLLLVSPLIWRHIRAHI